jgi:hypothetical protein
VPAGASVGPTALPRPVDVGVSEPVRGPVGVPGTSCDVAPEFVASGSATVPGALRPS